MCVIGLLSVVNTFSTTTTTTTNYEVYFWYLIPTEFRGPKDSLKHFPSTWVVKSLMERRNMASPIGLTLTCRTYLTLSPAYNYYNKLQMSSMRILLFWWSIITPPCHPLPFVISRIQSCFNNSHYSYILEYCT